MKRLISLALTAGLTVLLAACGNTVQTTSGSRYLEGYGSASAPAAASQPGAAPAAYSGPAGTVDAEIAAAANIEPQLRFPARLGLARIDHGGLVPVPAAEAAAWQGLAESLGSGYGEFVPISPLIAALATPDERAVVGHDGTRTYRSGLSETVRRIRLGAARLHVDAVLIYETFGRSEESSNPLGLTKLALIGFFLPTENVEAEGFAQAVLVDVRNGYTYGTASAVAEKPSHRLTTVSDSYDAHDSARREAEARAVAALTGEVEVMVRDLRLALAEQRAAPQNTQ
ncbi:hypothetical protein [Pelagibius marinus]|uniref:hypothetical protein n=1 Tax=Pelagibius marinus TaxID=2762760 RepID=UPI001872C875|nr:hypothetical protein [Pelagibius marinus]